MARYYAKQPEMPGYRSYPVVRTSHEDGIWSVDWTARNQLVTGSVDEAVKVWDPKIIPPRDDTEERRVDLGAVKSYSGHRLGVISAVSNSTGDLLACSSLDNTIRFWDLATNTESSIDAGPVEAWSLAIDRSDKLIASGTQRGAINIWSIADKTKRCSLAHGGKGQFVMSVAFSNQSKGGKGKASAAGAGYSQFVAGGGNDGSVYYYDVEVEKMAARFDELQGHTLPVRDLAFAKDDSLIFTASDDMTVHVYDTKRRGMVATLAGHSSWVLGLAVSPDGRHIATGSSDRTVKIWDLGTKSCVHTFTGASDQVWSLAYSPDGTKLAAGVDDGSVMIFETPNTRQSAEQRRGTIDEEDEEDEMEAEDERTED